MAEVDKRVNGKFKYVTFKLFDKTPLKGMNLKPVKP